MQLLEYARNGTAENGVCGTRKPIQKRKTLDDFKTGKLVVSQSQAGQTLDDEGDSLRLGRYEFWN